MFDNLRLTQGLPADFTDKSGEDYEAPLEPEFRARCKKPRGRQDY